MGTNLSPQVFNGGTFDVVSYFADPAGSADSSTAVQAAMTAAQTYAASNGRATVKFPAGKYKLNSTVRVIGGNVTIDAYGAYIFAGSNNDLFRDWSSQDTSYTLNGSGLTVLGGTWDCKGQNWGTGSNSSLNAGGFSAFTLSNSSKLTFRDVTVRNVYKYHGMDINTCQDVVIENCRFEGFQNNFTWHQDVVVATTVNITLSGTQTIDAIGVVAGNRVLVKNQTSAKDNGVYVCAAGSWSRASDMTTSSQFNNAAVHITSGTAGAGKAYYQSAYNPTVGTTSITWAQSVDSIGGADTRDFSEAIQLDRVSSAPATINVTIQGCYMGPAIDGSGLGGFGKLAGTHTSATTDYANIRVSNCFVDSPINVGINAYHWSNSVVSNNVINTSVNWEAIVVDSASGTVVSGNTITQNGVIGVVKPTFGTTLKSDAHGIRLGNKDSGCTDCVISGNTIVGNASSGEGIQTQGSLRCKVVGNHVYSMGLHGIYLSATSVNCTVVGNTAIGCGRFDGTTKGAISASGTNGAGTMITGNTVRMYGSGNEVIDAIAMEGSGTSTTFMANNDVGTEWGTNQFDGYLWSNSANLKTQGLIAAATATSTTSLSSSDTAVTGLSIPNLPPGTYDVEGYLLTGSLSGATVLCRFESSGAPTATLVNVDAWRSRSSTGGAITAIGSDVSANLGTSLSGTQAFHLKGILVTSTSGTIAVGMTLSAGTGNAVAGGWIKLTRRD